MSMGVFFYSCKDKEPTSAQCDRAVIVSDRNFDRAKDESDFSIQEVTISENCMTVKYSYSGGCGDIHTELVAAENSMQNTLNLPQVNMKLAIDDTDNCEALITTAEEFDISALQANGSPIIIKLHKWEDPIVYTY